MILNPNLYKASFPPLKRIYERDIAKGDKDQETIIAELSICSSVPVLAVTLFIQKEYGTNESLEKSINTLITFYHYINIIPLE